MSQVMTVDELVDVLQRLSNQGHGDATCYTDARGPIMAVRVEGDTVTFDWWKDRP